MPEMSKENYEALLARLEEQDKTIQDLNSKVADMSNLMKANISRKSASNQNQVDPEQRKKELSEKLERSLS